MELLSIQNKNDIPKAILDTPLGYMLKCHNLQETFSDNEKPELIIATCMDYRINLNIPRKLAYIIRTAGARISGSEFKISFASSLASIRHVAIIGHTQCGMSNLKQKKEVFVQGGMSTIGWSKDQAEEHFESNEPSFGIASEADFTKSECEKLKKLYPKLTIVPFLYKVEDNKLYLIE